jgi:ADP-heptose:LPS heptosyltransferase
MRALVLNLTRFGDLIQTQHLLSLLKHQGYEVGLACLENFAAAASLLNDVADVHPLSGAKLLAHLEQEWRRPLSELDRFKTRVEAFAPDLVINLTPSLPARLLTTMLPAGEHRGFCLDNMGFGVYSSPWAAFLQASSRFRGQSPFNLVDLLIKVAHLQPCAPLVPTNRGRDPREDSINWLRRMSPVQPRRFVGFQLGASEDRRRWPVEFFARLGQTLWEKHSALPVLLGSSSETRLGERYKESNAPCLNLIGRTEMGELATGLRGMDVLVTNDTGTMHLAAGLNTPVAALFLATAQPWDTGPYLEGCLCLEPDLDCHPCAFGRSCAHDLACRRCIAPTEVLHQLESFFATGEWAESRGSGVRAWITRRDPHGFMGLDSLSGHMETDRSAWILIQRHLYRHFLDERACSPPSTGPGHLSPQPLATMLGLLDRGRDLLILLSRQSEVLERSSHMERKFLATWRSLSCLLEEDPHLSVLAHLWVIQTQEQGFDLVSLQKTIDRYRALFEVMLLHLESAPGLSSA